jgi:hypothetical protein
MGTKWDGCSRFHKVLAKHGGSPENFAPLASAPNSRLREIAICTSMAAIGGIKIIN